MWNVHPALRPSGSAWKIRESGKLASMNPPDPRIGSSVAATIDPLQLNVAPAPVPSGHPNVIDCPLKLVADAFENVVTTAGSPSTIPTEFVSITAAGAPCRLLYTVFSCP